MAHGWLRRAATGWRKDEAPPAFCILVAWTSSKSPHDVPFSPSSETLSRGRGPHALSSAADPGQSSHGRGALGCLDAWRGLGVSILVYVKLGAAASVTPVARQLPPQGPASHQGRVNPAPAVGLPDASQATKNLLEFCLIIKTHNQQDGIAWRFCFSPEALPLPRDQSPLPSLDFLIHQTRMGTPSGLSSFLNSGIL